MPSNEIMTVNLQRVEPSQTLAPLPEGQVHTYAVRHESARRWVDLSLHLSDLEVTLSWLELLIHKHTQRTPEADALWTAALTMFFKCFQHSESRSKLNAALVLANEPEEGRAGFEVLKSLRNKTIVHDENAYTQGAVLVPIANPNEPVAKRGSPSVTLFKASTLDDAQIGNLRLLTLASITYVNSEIAKASVEVEAYLSSVSRADLVAAGPYLYIAPAIETVNRRRSD